MKREETRKSEKKCSDQIVISVNQLFCHYGPNDQLWEMNEMFEMIDDGHRPAWHTEGTTHDKLIGWREPLVLAALDSSEIVGVELRNPHMGWPTNLSVLLVKLGRLTLDYLV